MDRNWNKIGAIGTLVGVVFTSLIGIGGLGLMWWIYTHPLPQPDSTIEFGQQVKVMPIPWWMPVLIVVAIFGAGVLHLVAIRRSRPTVPASEVPVLSPGVEPWKTKEWWRNRAEALGRDVQRLTEENTTLRVAAKEFNDAREQLRKQLAEAPRITLRHERVRDWDYLSFGADKNIVVDCVGPLVGAHSHSLNFEQAPRYIEGGNPHRSRVSAQQENHVTSLLGVVIPDKEVNYTLTVWYTGPGNHRFVRTFSLHRSGGLLECRPTGDPALFSEGQQQQH